MAHPPHRTDAMPRLPRIDLPHIPQHVVQRGNGRRPCFFQPIDHVRYLDELRTAATRAGCAIHAYVLMTNHVHLLVTPGASGQVGAMMQALGRRYVRYVNDRYGRTGTLWEPLQSVPRAKRRAPAALLPLHRAQPGPRCNGGDAR